jgi:hypothetical protein
MGGVIAHPKVDLDHGGDARQGPPFGGKALRSGPSQQELQQVLVLLVAHLARCPRHRLGGERRVAASLPGRAPLRHRAHRGLHPAGHLAQAQALLEQRHRAAAAF